MANKIPVFTTDCEHESYMSGGTWYILLKSSGTFAFKYSKTKVDVFLQGGGGGGAGWDDRQGAGGGAGGYQNTVYGTAIGSEQQIIVIGAGGASGAKGGKTSAFGFSAEGGGYGGDTGNIRVGSTAGTGAGGHGGYYNASMNTGDPGGNGADGLLAFGVGDTYYGAGGGGCGAAFDRDHGSGGKTGGGTGYEGNGAANTGAGGAGIGSGGSGIIILRGTQDDQLPVKFDGVTLQRIMYDGEEVLHLIHDGTTIFIERVRRWFAEWLRRGTLLQQPVN